jgi:hypothetical protein
MICFTFSFWFLCICCGRLVVFFSCLIMSLYITLIIDFIAFSKYFWWLLKNNNIFEYLKRDRFWLTEPYKKKKYNQIIFLWWVNRKGWRKERRRKRDFSESERNKQGLRKANGAWKRRKRRFWPYFATRTPNTDMWPLLSMCFTDGTISILLCP